MIQQLISHLGPEAVFYFNLSVNLLVAVVVYIVARGALTFFGYVSSQAKNSSYQEELALVEKIALKAVNYAEENYRHKTKTLGDEILKGVNTSDTKLRDAVSLASSELFSLGVEMSSKKVEQAVKAALAASRRK